MKKIVLAFDSFKGSVGSFEIAKAAEKAIQEELPDCQIIRFPIADGGEGTTEALCSALHAQTVSCRVHDPFMKPIEVSYGIVNNGAMAIIEMASACGLPLIDSNRRNPMKTTTYGVGEMVADALKRGCREFIIGIGGSATNDAGIGMLKALGARFLDSGNGELEPVGENLIKVYQIDISQLNPALKESHFTIACDYLSYWKIRGSFASVGTAFKRYIANPLFTWNTSIGQWSNLTDFPVYNLKPERTNSFEVGMNMRFFKNFELDVTYYNAKTMNQTFNPELPVGEYARIYIQTGAVRNQGLELALNYNNTWKDFTWNTGVTYSMNKNKILTLADNAINPITGEKFSISSLNMGGLGSTRFILKEGGSMGDIYSLMDLKRDANGAVYIDENNSVVTESLEANNYIKLGSVLPKGNLAWRNNFSWKNINVAFLVSARLGGVVFSRTQAVLDNFGVSEASAAARDKGYVSVNGNDRVNPEGWYSVVAGGTAVPQYYIYSATNIRLQEASIGYTIPRKWLGNVCDIKVSLIGRNLWMIYNKAPFDPEAVASTDNFYQGIDNFMMPSLRNVGFSLNFKF